VLKDLDGYQHPRTVGRARHHLPRCSTMAVMDFAAYGKQCDQVGAIEHTALRRAFRQRGIPYAKDSGAGSRPQRISTPTLPQAHV